jgi:hypothetical protein
MRAFTAATKSTVALMTDELDLELRSNLSAVIKSARQQYQQLLDFASTASRRNPRSRSVTPRIGFQDRSSIVPSIETEMECESLMSKETKAARDYQSDKARPNIHTALHYEVIMQEYGLPSICMY